MQQFEILKRIIMEYTTCRSEEITIDTSLIYDLELNSLDITNIVVAIEEEFDVEISDNDLRLLQTVNDIMLLLKSKCQKCSKAGA